MRVPNRFCGIRIPASYLKPGNRDSVWWTGRRIGERLGRDCKYDERDTRFGNFTRRESGNIAQKNGDLGSPLIKFTRKIKLSS